MGELDDVIRTGPPLAPPEGAVSEGSSGSSGDRPRGSGARWRGWLAAALVVIGSLLAATANVGVWARETALDTDTYVETVTPIIGDEEITSAVSRYLTEQVLELVDIQQLADELLPGPLSAIGGSLEGLVSDGLTTLTEDILRSGPLQDFWVFINREAHELFLDALTGESDYLRVDGNRVILDLSEPLAALDDEIEDLVGIRVFDDATGDGRAQFVLYESEEIGEVKSSLETLDWLSVALPIAAAAVLVLAVLIANRRLLVLALAGFGVAAAVLLFLLIEAGAQWSVLQSVTDPVSKLAGESLWDIASRGLTTQSFWVALAGAVIGGAALTAEIVRNRRLR